MSHANAFGISDKIYGLSYADWTVKWWHWFLDERHEQKLVSFASSKYMKASDKTVLETHAEVNQKMPILVNIDKWISLGFSFSSDQELKKSPSKG